MTALKDSTDKGFFIDVSKVKVRSVEVTLEKSDFTTDEEIENGSIVSAEEEEIKQFIGLKMTVITQFPMRVKKQIMGLAAIQGEKDPARILAAFDEYSSAMAQLITRWNIRGGDGKELSVSPETLDNLPEPLQVAVTQLFNKAVDAGGGLEKN